MSKSNEYGYLPSSPTQAGGSNTGVFESNDIIELLADNKWSLQEAPALNLIQHQTASSVTSIDFTSIQGSTYDYHYLTWTDIDTGIRDNNNIWNMRVKVGGTNQGSNYYNNGQSVTWGSNSGQSYKSRNFHSGQTGLIRLGQVQRGYGDNVSSVDSSANGWALISFAHNSNYWTTVHTQTIGQSYASGSSPYRGVAFHQSNSTVDGFSIYMSGYTFSGQLALYGIST